jgi:hypothetical protein
MNVRRLAATAALAALVVVPACGDDATPRDADGAPVVVGAMEGIARAFADHPVVAIGETHGSQELHQFLLEAVHDPHVRSRTRTLAVEVGASAQEAIDAYLAGQRSDSALLAALRDSTFSETGAADPRSVELYRAIRDANRGSDQPWRVVAVDSPLSWQEVRTSEDLSRFDREADMARGLGQLVEQGGSVLWVVGGAHLRPGTLEVPVQPQEREPLDRTDLPTGTPDEVEVSAVELDPVGPPADAEETVQVGSARALFELDHPGQVFVAELYTGFVDRTAELEARLGAPSAPSLVLIDGSWLAEAHDLGLGAPNAPGDVITGSPGDGGSRADTPSALAGIHALLYLGDCGSLTAREPPSDAFADAAYVAELDRRRAIRGAGPFDEAEYRSFSRSLFGNCD